VNNSKASNDVTCPNVSANISINSPENTPLWKRGDRGDFMDDFLITKIPPNPWSPSAQPEAGKLLLPKGGIYGVFIPLRVPKAHEGFVRNIIRVEIPDRDSSYICNFFK